MQSLKHLLGKLGVIAQADNRHAAGKYALLPVHVEAMRYLSRCNRYSNTPAALGHYLNTTKGTISQSLKVLERAGLINKLSDNKDKRVTRLKLTAKGQNRLNQIDESSAYQHAIESLPPEIKDQLQQGLILLLKNLQRNSDVPGFGVCRSCRFFRISTNGRSSCDITGEWLSVSDSEKICIEHQYKPVGAIR